MKNLWILCLNFPRKINNNCKNQTVVIWIWIAKIIKLVKIFLKIIINN